MRNNTNHLLDCLKGLGCVAVVFIHIKFPGFTGDAIWRLAQFAVPIFFMTSGYFAYNTDRELVNIVLKRRSRRILWLSIWTSLLYFVLTNGYNVIKNGCLQWGTSANLFSSTLKFIVFQDVDFSGGFHLWFLWALFWSYIILLLINYFDLLEVAHKSLLLLLVMNVVLSSLRLYYGWSWHSTGNVLTAIMWVLIGTYIARNRYRMNISNKKLILYAVLGAIWSLTLLLKMTYDFSQIGIIIFAVSLFLLAVNNPNISVGGSIEKIGRKYSLDIYIFHILVAMIFTKMLIYVGDDLFYIMWLKPIMVVVGTFFVAKIREKISNANIEYTQ